MSVRIHRPPPTRFGPPAAQPASAPLPARRFPPPPIVAAPPVLRRGIVQGWFRGGAPIPASGQRRGAGGASAAMPLPPGLTLVAAGGMRLPDLVQRQMEAFFKADFSDVRVRVGPEAPAIGALAFTIGSTLFFAPGRYQPDAPQGRRLIGHELAHVLQQRAGRVRHPSGAGIAIVQDAALEAEAERLGTRAAIACGAAPTARAVQAAFRHPAHRVAPARFRTIQRMEHTREILVPTESQMEIIEEIGETKTASGGLQTGNKKRGDIFEIDTEKFLNDSGHYKLVKNSNDIVANSAGIDFICIGLDDSVMFVQCKNHPVASDYVGEILRSRTMAQKFAYLMYGASFGKDIGVSAQTMRDYLDGTGNKYLKWLVAQVAKAKDSFESLETDSELVLSVDARLHFSVPKDLYAEIPKLLRKRCFALKHSTQWYQRLLSGMNYKVTKPGINKQKDKDEAEWTGN